MASTGSSSSAAGGEGEPDGGFPSLSVLAFLNLAFLALGFSALTPLAHPGWTGAHWD